MTISVACPHCRRSYQVPSEFAGRQFRCRACGDTVAIPEPPPVEIDADPEDATDDVHVLDEPAPVAARVPMRPVSKPLRAERRRDRGEDQMPSTILLALVIGGLHMAQDLFFVICGFSAAGDAPQSAGLIILGGLIMLAIELSLFTGLIRRHAVARLASMVLTALGLGLQVLIVLTMSWVAIVGHTFPDIDPEDAQVVAGFMTGCGLIGIVLRIGNLAALAPGSAAQWCDVPVNRGT